MLRSITSQFTNTFKFISSSKNTFQISLIDINFLQFYFLHIYFLIFSEQNSVVVNG